MVRRRVPSSEVEDLVQSVLCEALAAGSIPPDRSEISRWVMGIARHKVADYHRGAGRRTRLEDPTPGEDGRLAAVEGVIVDPAEERDLLRRVLAASEGSAERVRMLEWMVREHQGDCLARIAEEERLPAPVVRKRLSRFRSQLRARWLLAAAAIIGLGLLIGFRSVQPVQDGRGRPIEAPAAGTVMSLRVSEITMPPDLDEARSALLESEAALATIHKNGNVIVIQTPARTMKGVLEIEASGRRGNLRLDDGRTYRLEIDQASDRIGVLVAGARVVLEPAPQ
jgi:DNA-directed RNA polymerase specialized sigma24 family protein